MSEPPDLLGVVWRWVQKAENDLITAEHTLMLDENCPYDTICFHAQQCVEKYLKALLTSTHTDFPKTHDLVELGALIPHNIEIAIDESDLAELSPYAVEARYPDDFLPLTRARAERAAAMARKIRGAILGHLPQAGPSV